MRKVPSNRRRLLVDAVGDAAEACRARARISTWSLTCLQRASLLLAEVPYDRLTVHLAREAAESLAGAPVEVVSVRSGTDTVGCFVRDAANDAGGAGVAVQGSPQWMSGVPTKGREALPLLEVAAFRR